MAHQMFRLFWTSTNSYKSQSKQFIETFKWVKKIIFQKICNLTTVHNYKTDIVFIKINAKLWRVFM